MTYHVREWLNKEGVNATSQITAYHGEASFHNDKNEVQTFEEKKLSIADCHYAIRIHQTPQMSNQDYIDKINLIAKVCFDFAKHLQEFEDKSKIEASKKKILEQSAEGFIQSIIDRT